MPGLNIVISSSLDQQTLSRALADLESDSVSEAEILYKDDRFISREKGQSL